MLRLAKTFLLAILLLAIVSANANLLNYSQESRELQDSQKIFSHKIKIKVVKDSAEVSKIKLKSYASTVDPEGGELFELADGYDVKITYTIKNLTDEEQTFSIRDTPLENPVSTNFSGTSDDVYYSGKISEVHGKFDQKKLKKLQGGDELSNIWSMKDAGVLFSPNGNNQTIAFQLSYTLYMPDPDKPDETERTAHYLDADTDSIDILVEQELKSGPGRNLQKSRRNLELKNDGVPRYEFTQCANDLSVFRHETYGGRFSDFECSKDYLKRKFCASGWIAAKTAEYCTANKCQHMADMRKACPVLCRSCENWGNPKNDRKYSFVGCTDKDKSMIVDAERLKKRRCRKILYHFKEMKKNNLSGFNDSTVLGKIVKKYFAGKSALLQEDSKLFLKLYTGIVKICSADSYEYDCAPKKSCTISGARACTSTWNEKNWVSKMPLIQSKKAATSGYNEFNPPQKDVIDALSAFDSNCTREKWLEKNTTPYALYSGSQIAYIFSGESLKRTIHCSRLTFWLQEDDELTTDNNMSSTIVHELTHFSDVLATGDLGYGMGQVKNLPTDRKFRNAQNYAYFFTDAQWDSVAEDNWGSEWIATPFETKLSKDDSAARVAKNMEYLRTRDGNTSSANTSEFKVVTAIIPILFSVLVFII